MLTLKGVRSSLPQIQAEDWSRRKTRFPQVPASDLQGAPSLNPTRSGHAGSAAIYACAPRPWESRGRARPRGPAHGRVLSRLCERARKAAREGACALSPPGGQKRNNSRAGGSRFGGRRGQALRRAELETSASNHPGADLAVLRPPSFPWVHFQFRTSKRGGHQPWVPCMCQAFFMYYLIKSSQLCPWAASPVYREETEARHS